MSNQEVTTYNPQAGGGYLTLIENDDFTLLMGATSDMGSAGGIFLKHNGNNGEYTYGSGDDELESGSQLVADFGSVQRGYICWKDEKPVEEVMRSFRDGGAPPKHTLTDHGPYDEGDGWSEQAILRLKMTEAPFLDLTFKASGISKLNAFGALMKDFGSQYKVNPGKLPVIEIGNQEFQSKAKGAKKATKFAPTLKIVAWITPEQAKALDEGAEDDYAEGGAPQEALVEAPVLSRPQRAAPAEAPATKRGRF